MAKTKSSYFCSNCGNESPKWIGRCPACQQWNTYVEEVVVKQINTPGQQNLSRSKPQKLDEISTSDYIRQNSGMLEMDRILGGGIIPGSVILLGGEPGIGKSTLALQMALMTKQNVLYNSGEESDKQVKMRTSRLEASNENCYILTDQNIETLLTHARQINPGLLIVDSIQTMRTDLIDSTPGSVSQIKECTQLLIQYAKQNNVPVVLIGHITKEGNIAGPKLLEHMVDIVVLFEGDSTLSYRTIRTLKNRFGPVPELAVFEMTQQGLEEVLNPSTFFLNLNQENHPGVAVACIMDGIRPMFIEAQALVTQAVYASPQRNCTGFDIRRLNMLLAVIEKKIGIKVLQKDVFINIAGGIKIQDPAVDLAVAMAIVSSNLNLSLPEQICFCAEISLTGLLKKVGKIDQRILEAEKLGFNAVYTSGYSTMQPHKKIIVGGFNNLADAVRELFRAH